MRINKLLLIAILSFFLLACGTYQQTLQVDDKAYVLLIGNPEGNVVTIDGSKSIDLANETTSYNLNGETATKIQVTIGSHTVTIIKNGKMVVKRKFYVSTGHSFEIQI